MTRLIAACLVTVAAALAACSGEGPQDQLAAAKDALDKSDARAAAIHLKNTIQQDPASAEARYLLGKLLLEGGDPVAAAVELVKAEELQIPPELVLPELARARLALGEEARVIAQYAQLRLGDPAATADLMTSVAVAYAMQSNTARAREALEVALKAKPGYAQAVIVQARLKSGEGDFDGALALLDGVLASAPDNERAGVLKGEILNTAKKDGAGALQAYRKVLASNPKSVAAHSALVKLLSAQGKDGEARAQLDELKKVAPSHPETLFFEAEAAFADKDYKRSREITNRMLKGMPESVRVLELAGMAELAMKQHTQAEAFLAKAVKIAPDRLRPRQLLARTYLSANQPDKVAEALKPVLESKTVDGPTLSLAGQAWLQMGDTKRAETAFQAAAKVAPDDPQVRTTAALAQLARGNGGAVADLEKIAAQDSGLNADLALVSARLAQKDLAGALKAIDGIERKLPGQPVADNLRGRVQLIKGDRPAAAKAFEAALAKDANFFPAIAGLASIELAGGKPEAARKRFEDAAQAQPGNYQIFMALAELKVLTGGTSASAVQLLRDAVKAAPGASMPHLALVNQLLGIGENQQALAAAQAATAALPADLDIMQALGRAQLASGDGVQALATLKKAATLQPANPMHQLLLADVHVAAMDLKSAGEALRRALEIRPDLIQAKAGLARLALMERRPQDALAVAAEVQKLQPKLALGYTLEGDAETSRAHWDAAVAAYRKALQREPATVNMVRLHSTLRHAGRKLDADKAAAEWLKTRPGDVAFNLYLGDLAREAGDVAGAEARYRKVLDLQPDNVMALNNQAWLLVQQRKPGAVAMAEKAAALQPESAAVLDTLAAALAAEGKVTQAIEVQQRAVKHRPGDPGLRLSLARLYAKEGDKARARSELEDLARLGDRFPQQAEVARLLGTL